MSSWVLFGTSSSLENDMDHAHVSYRSQTMVIMMEKGLVLLFPCTTSTLDIHSCGVLLSCMWYTKQLLFSLCLCFGSIEMWGSSDPLSSPLLLDLSFDIGSLLVIRLLEEPLPEFETSIVYMDISNVVTMNSQRDVYVACQSWHISTFPSVIWIYSQYSIHILLVYV